MNCETSASFRYDSKAKKEALIHLKRVIEISPNRGHILQNKLRNTWRLTLKESTNLPLYVWTFSMQGKG